MSRICANGSARGAAQATLAMLLLSATRGEAADADACDLSRWLDAKSEFCVSLPPDAPRSGLRVFLGQADVSLWFEVNAAGQLVYRPAPVELAGGEQDLVVRSARDDGWADIARHTVKILAPGGFEKRTGHMSLGISVESQPAGRAGAGSANARGQFADIGLQSALGFELARAGTLWRFDSALVGSSYRNASLRYAQLGARAPRVDLGQYQFAVARAGTEVRFGHFAAGQHPLLLQDFDARGITLRQRFGSVADLTMASVNGSSIVGFDNLLGLSSSAHRIDTVTAGVELVPTTTGALRLELSWLRGSQLPIDDFNVGEITDAERSRGFGMRLSSNLFNDRLRADLAVAQSRYTNPKDEQLSQGSELVEVQPATAHSASLDLHWQMLRPSEQAGGPEITIRTHFDRAEPLYRSVASTLRADSQLAEIGLESIWRALALNVSVQQHHDNLDEVPTILRTRTTTRRVDGTIDLPSLDAVRASASYWPQLTLRWVQQQQIARNSPESFQPTHLPDQTNRQAALGLRWSTAHWEWTLELSDVLQDNRQAGRELADYRNLSQEIGVRYAPSDGFSLGVGAHRVRNHSVEQQRSEFTHAGWLSVQWSISRHWRYMGHYSLGRDFDSLDLGGERVATLQTELAAQYDLRQYGAVLPLQLFLRHSLTRGSRFERPFDVVATTRDWQLTAGFNVQLQSRP